MKLLLRVLTLCAVVVAIALPRIASAEPARTRRLAVVVGANDPAPGRQPLRYAQTDAQLMADVRAMSDRVEGSLARRRVAMLLLTLFAALALGLAAIGVYGVIA